MILSVMRKLGLILYLPVSATVLKSQNHFVIFTKPRLLSSANGANTMQSTQFGGDCGKKDV
jgi:hypothetical protein